MPDNSAPTSDKGSEIPADVLAQLSEMTLPEGADLRSRLEKEILLNAVKCRRDELDILDLKLISRALAEFRYAARVFKPYRKVRKVSIFGSARVEESDPDYQLAVRFGCMLARLGYMVITGAADGIMKAGIEGAGCDNSFGVNILLPLEQLPSKLIRDDPKLITFKYFFTRKVFFVMEADACALFPGGFGTHDEGFEVLTLLQTGKAPPMPLALMELPGGDYWEAWDHFVRKQLLAKGYISPEDLSFYKIVHSADEGLEYIQSYYSTFHSVRQVQDVLVMRLEKELSDVHLKQLSHSFRDIVRSGVIARTPPLPQEQDEPDLLEKPRIAFAYNKTSPGRLNELILAINAMGKTVDAPTPIRVLEPPRARNARPGARDSSDADSRRQPPPPAKIAA